MSRLLTCASTRLGRLRRAAVPVLAAVTAAAATAGLAVAVHDGDIKAGGDRCDQPVYDQFEAFLGSLRAPALYTPGANEWTDCDRPAAGAYDYEEGRELIRATFFDRQFSFGRRLRVEQQEAPYVENLRWRVGRVVYATLHVVGSDNNLGDLAPEPVEFAGRDAATNAWLRETFADARRSDAAAVLLVIQANPGFDASDPPAHRCAMPGHS